MKEIINKKEIMLEINKKNLKKEIRLEINKRDLKREIKMKNLKK